MVEFSDAAAGLSLKICKELLDNVLPFWLNHGRDLVNGGFNTTLDRTGIVTSCEKNIWMQARQVWMFSRVYQRIEQREDYLEMAQRGMRFLLESRAYAGNGRWNYLLSDDGREVQQGTISIYTDCFALMAICAYIEISGDDSLRHIAMDTYHVLVKNLQNPDFSDIFPQTHKPGILIHGIPMIALNALGESAAIVGDETSLPIRRFCMDQIMRLCYDPDYNCIRERRHIDGSPVSGETLINVGHNFEALWFVLEQAKGLERQDFHEQAMRMIPDILARAWDPRHGGILFILDTQRPEPDYQDWNVQRAMKWDDKVWWTHAEALCALAYAYRLSGDKQMLHHLTSLWDYCMEHFSDSVYGEWYSVLHRNGRIRLANKGGLQKAAFHVPRSLYTMLLLLNGKV